MTRYKTIDGITTECTAEEVAELNALKTAWDNKVFDRAIANLRNKRNRLLAETDYMANSDVTMSSAMTTYRQALRDITSGLDTVAKVNAKQFPTKPKDNS
jgi:hypothetical protein